MDGSDDEQVAEQVKFNAKNNMRNAVLKKEMKFPNAKVFRAALREYAVKKPVDIKFKLNERTKISVHCKNGSKRKAKDLINGDEQLQYGVLRDYAQMITTVDKGSRVILYTKMANESFQPKFKRMYVRFNAQNVGFLGGCRPFIGLDGCHIKHRFGGQILSATAKDANDNIFSVAMAVVEQEIRESWIRFLKIFANDIGRPKELQLVFISDRQKGLIPTIETLFPTVEHKYCVKHIYNNFKVHHKGLELKDALWRCAAIKTVREFERCMQYIRDLDEKAYEYLSRDKPILAMLEWIRVRLMTKLYTKRKRIQKYAEKLCPSIQDRLEKLKVESKPFSATPTGSFLYKVGSQYERHVVDLVKKTCSSIYTNIETPKEYTHPCYFKEIYMGIYKEVLPTMPCQSEWADTRQPAPLAPHIYKPLGRPPKQRKRASNEPRNPYKASRLNRPIRCEKCKKEGHNSRGCKASITGETPWQRRQRLAKEKAARGGEPAPKSAPEPAPQSPSQQPT
ncbi:uncharacterized protein LOC112025084 [Quercus suber]|uniref:uncharacterized protein LOC112025084 n=1 Tax=Quercus suber TaxID=58331 RepID=UPI000CE1C7D3|nr:uncharacterized protein LOC112025084 [Quercus suber]